MDFSLRQWHGHSFQEGEGLEAYYCTELLCDCALDKLYPSRGCIAYSALQQGDQIVELNRCICMGKQIVSVLCKALLFRHKWFLGGTWKTERAASLLKEPEHHSYENETQPNTRCRPSHLSGTIHSSHKKNLGFSRCLHSKEGEIRPAKYHRYQNFRQEGYVCL